MTTRMTMTQKILAAHAGLPSVKAGDLIEAKLDMVLGNDITSPVAIDVFDKAGFTRVFDKEKMVELRDKYKLDFIDDNSGSVYKVCSKFGVLVVTIKGISNFGIKREEYLKYKEYARQKANLVLERILDREEQK